jgi:hypothetical protein
VNSYEEGKDVNANNLMADALTKYKARKLTDKWSAPTKEQGRILALTAQVELLSKSAKKSPSKSNLTPKAPKKDKDNKWAWKDVLLKDREPTTKEFGGKQYHINCKHHPNQWVCHTTAKCSKNPANAGATPPGKQETSIIERRLQGAKIAASVSTAGESSNTEPLSDDDDY